MTPENWEAIPDAPLPLPAPRRSPGIGVPYLSLLHSYSKLREERDTLRARLAEAEAERGGVGL